MKKQGIKLLGILLAAILLLEDNTDNGDNDGMMTTCSMSF